MMRTNLKMTLAYRGLDFIGWEDQQHELYRGNNSNKKNGREEEISGSEGGLSGEQVPTKSKRTLMPLSCGQFQGKKVCVQNENIEA